MHQQLITGSCGLCAGRISHVRDSVYSGQPLLARVLFQQSTSFRSHLLLSFMSCNSFTVLQDEAG